MQWQENTAETMQAIPNQQLNQLEQIQIMHGMNITPKFFINCILVIHVVNGQV